jgi:hypothetical protein
MACLLTLSSSQPVLPFVVGTRTELSVQGRERFRAFHEIEKGQPDQAEVSRRPAALKSPGRRLQVRLPARPPPPTSRGARADRRLRKAGYMTWKNHLGHDGEDVRSFRILRRI